MLNNIGRLQFLRASVWTGALLVMGFVFCHADGVQAQSNWGGILNRVPEAIGTHSRAPQNQRSTQSKTEMEGFVTIQSITTGQIPKFTSGTGTTDDSVITQSSGGNIGIGTTAPQKPLHVVATNYATGIAVG